MASLSNTMRVLSSNCRGLRNKNKMKDVLNYIKDLNPDIVCLQDTHWVESDLRTLKSIWNYECLIHGKDTNSRGVSILFSNKIEYKIIDTFKDDLGNILAININISNDFTIFLINIYGPNKDNPQFYEDIEKLIITNTSDYILICGDLNITLDPTKDSINYTAKFSTNNPKSRKKILEIMENHSLVDVFRNLNPTLQHYTWRKPNSDKKARLDYFIVSNTLMDLIPNTKIIYGHRTDHSIIEIQIQLNKFQRGPGTWKFNSSLLKNKTYVELINKTIDETIEEYIVPIYNPLKIHDVPKNEITLTIDDTLFLDTLLMKIRGKSIRFSGKQKRIQNEKEQKLIREIEQLESNPTLSNLNTLIQDKKIELQEIRNIRLKGNMIRSRAQWLDEGERPTKYFCALENKNFLDKTIKKVCNDENEIITDQKKILSAIETYYSNLFRSRDTELNNIKIEDLFPNQDINKLTDEQKLDLEGELTIKEIGVALKNMKNDKSPGLDGFTSEFFKFFWSKLKYFVLRCLNDSYRKGNLPQTLRTCVITCLPKQNKQRQHLKNWRPISLLNVVYKIASSSIANRLKTVLNKIISKTQNGFLDGRYIGESTRIIYDIMQLCDDQKKDGLLLLVDFEKAFDSVSWAFLYKTFKFFNFGTSIISWITLFNNNVTAYISQCGYLSNKIPIQRGCRQGDPIASYEFLLCAEILSKMLTTNKKIKGISVFENEYLVSQFADDTTILLDGTQRSLSGSLNTLEVFGTISGLKMNTDKTKVIWIGRKKHSKDKLITNYNLIWGEEEFDLLGITFNVNLELTTTKNYQKAQIKINETIKSWNKRYLTPLGKITVIKTFLLSQLNHIFLAMPNPKPEIIKEINNSIFKFLWDNKPDKIKRLQATLPIYLGGLNMINIEHFIMALKITWIRRLTTTENSPTKILFESSIMAVNKLFNFGYQYIENKIKNIRNKFWQDTLSSWVYMCKKFQPTKYSELYTMPIWHNPYISTYPMFFPELYNNGINLIGDLLTDNGEIISKEELLHKTHLNSINPLHYLQLKSAVKSTLKKINFRPYTLQKPIAPFTYRIITKSRKGSKDFYKILQSNQEIKTHPKWENIVNKEFSIQEWTYIHKTCFKTINDNYLSYLQFKIINNILGTRSLLYKILISNNPYCIFCREHEETIPHLFYECEQVKLLWETLFNWILNKTNIRITPNITPILLGYLEPYPNPIPVNTINMITKSYIFYCSRNNLKLNIYNLQIRIKSTYQTYEFIAIKNNKKNNFDHIWKPFKQLF